ncbi:MAG: type II secretion system F family protein [Pirellulaceae bacterium]|nr:type II secretion system F family protein [Pirellulaceae bacterium]
MILAQGIDFVSLLPFAIFGACAVVAWLLLEWFSGRKSRAEQRLDEYRDPRRRAPRDERPGSRAADTVTRVLERASPALAKPIQPKTESEAGQLKLRLSQAGFRGEAAPTIFLGFKIVGLVLGLVFSGGFLWVMTEVTQTSLLENRNAILRSLVVAGCLFYLPDAIVWLLSRHRKQQIFLGLPDALDLMVVCVEAGLGLDQAMRKVAEEMKKAHRTIAEEFGLCNLQMQMGRSRQHVLKELGLRSGVEDLRTLASILVQADRFGSSIAQALRVQSDSMRTRRRQIAEEKAAKTAVKLIFPLVMFIFPGIFVVLVGPAAINVVREMLPVMNGG